MNKEQQALFWKLIKQHTMLHSDGCETIEIEVLKQIMEEVLNA